MHVTICGRVNVSEPHRQQNFLQAIDEGSYVGLLVGHLLICCNTGRMATTQKAHDTAHSTTCVLLYMPSMSVSLCLRYNKLEFLQATCEPPSLLYQREPYRGSPCM